MNPNPDFRNQIYTRLAKNPHPVFVFQNTVIPAATIWVGVRAWSNYFRELGLEPGDRIIVSYPESPAFLHILLAAIWEKLTLIIIKPSSVNSELVESLDPKLIITFDDLADSIQPDNMGLPPNTIRLRRTYIQKDMNIRFIIQSSGSTGNPKYICLTEKGVLSILESHKIIFESKDNVALSVLPWSHCFGLVLDLLLGIFHAECIVRDPENGKNIESLISLFRKYNITHFSGVPLLFERILQKSDGIDFLHRLDSGIIGGAPIPNLISENLKGSKLCVGYGQTEASPGICLGEKGIFYTNYIGNPLGCKIKISNEGELFFKGDNSYFGYWENGSVKKNSNNSWIRTGDIVEKKKEGLFFKGRLDFSFKLPNGILIQPEEIEESLKIKVPEISNCLLFNSNELHLLVSTYEPDLQPRLVKSIKENMSPILKNSSIKIDTVSSSDWFFSPKGGIDRKKMIQKFK